MAKNQVRIGVGVNDQASKPIKSISDAFHRLQTQGGKGFAIGAGAAVTAKAFDLVGSAVGAVGDVLANAEQEFLADEKSIAQLTTSLRANAKGWDGSTDAIEKTLKARMDLGFSDDEQRTSLGKLVGAYGNVNKALAVQRTAMDLARFSGTDLATASDVLTKVHAGSYRALKALGISTKGVTNETEALAAVYKVVNGQASAFADTVGGKLLAAETKLKDKTEELGKAWAPFDVGVKEAEINVLNATQSAIEGWGSFIQFLADPKGWNAVQINAHKAGAAAAAAAQQAAFAIRDEADSVQALAGDSADLSDEQQALADEVKALGSAFDIARRAVEKLNGAFDIFTGAEFDATIAAGELAQQQKDLADLLKEGPASKGAADIAIWKGKVAEAKQGLFDLQYQMKQSEGPAALQAWLLTVQDGLAATDVKGRAAIATLLRLNATMVSVAAMANASKDDIFIPPSVKALPRPKARATGGPASGLTLVGEKGPELLDLPGGSNVIDAQKTGTIMGGATTNIINLTVQGDLRARDKEDVVSALRRAAAFIR